MESVYSIHAPKPAYVAPRTLAPAGLLEETASKTTRGVDSTARALAYVLSSVLLLPLMASGQTGTTPLASASMAQVKAAMA